MSGTAVTLVLTSAFLHALWNARAHTGGDRVMEVAVAYATGTVLLSPWLVIDPPVEVIGWVVLSGVAHGGYIWGLATAYSRGGLAPPSPAARRRTAAISKNSSALMSRPPRPPTKEASTGRAPGRP